MDSTFWWSLLNIVLIDIILAGDNALIIAAATRDLHGRAKRIGMIAGTCLAAVMRLLFLAIASWLLHYPYIYLIGGAYIVFLAFKLFDKHEPHKEVRPGKKIFEAIWIIGSADALMSLDNVLAVAGAAAGNFWLLVAGVFLSIPIIFAAASFLSTLMERHRTVMLIGSLVLARVGGKMIAEEKILAPWVGGFWHYGIQVAAVLSVLGFYLLNRKTK